MAYTNLLKKLQEERKKKESQVYVVKDERGKRVNQEKAKFDNVVAPYRKGSGSYNFSGINDTVRLSTYAPKEKSWTEKILQVPEVFKDNSDKAKDLLSDGFQLKDAFSMYSEISKDTGKTILGTTADAGLGVVKGIVNVGEGLGDAVTYGIAQIHDWAGNDERANQLRRNASVDVINNAFAKPQSYVNKASVLGESGDKVAEGIGYMASIWAASVVGGAGAGLLSKGSKATKALSAVDKAAKIKKATDIGSTVAQSGLIFSNSTGTNMADIYQQYGTDGVTSGEAWGKALGGAAVETVTEQLFGMFGKADTKIVNGLAKRANSALGKVLTRAGVQAFGEGMEEVIAYAGNYAVDRIVDAASKGEGATFAQEWSWEDVWEQAGIAALTALSMGGGQTSASVLNNKNSNNTWKDALNETAIQQDVQAQEENLNTEIDKLNKKIKKATDTAQVEQLQEELEWKHKQLNALKGQVAPIDTNIQDNLTQEQYIRELDALQREYLQAPDAHAQTVLQQQITDLQAQAERQGINTNAQQITNTQVQDETAVENVENIVQKVIENTNKRIENKYYKDKVEFVPIEKLENIKEFDRLGKNKNKTDEELQKLKNEIIENGIDPLGVLYDPTTGNTIINEGNTRLALAKELGLSEIPVIVTRAADNSYFEGKTTNSLKKGVGSEDTQYMKYSEIDIEPQTQNIDAIKTKDNQGREVSKELQEGLKESQVRDEQGRLLTVYHGSPNENIADFDSSKAGSNTQSDFTGIYFTDNQSVADDFSYEQLQGNSNLTYKRGKKGKVYESYLNIKNPLNLNNLTDEDIDNLSKYIDKGKAVDGLEFAINTMKQMNKYKNAQGIKFYLDLEAIKNSGEYDGIIADMGGSYKGSNEYIVFENGQIENLTNNAEVSDTTAQIEQTIEEAIAPVLEQISQVAEQVQELKEDIIPIAEQNQAPTEQDIVEQQGEQDSKTLTDEDMLPIPEDTTPEVENETTTESKVESPFDSRDIKEVGKRNVKAYQYENPEVRPYFQAEAENMLYDLDNTIKGEKTVTQVYNPYTGLYENAEWTGTTRQTTEAIAYLRDNYKYSYAQIRKGLNDIIEDNGKENNAVAKRIEFMLDERLREGYTTSDGFPIPANEEYINFLKEKQVTEYDRERLEALAIDENVPEEVVEETTINAEPEQTTDLEQANALEQYEATLQDELSPTVNTDVFEDIDTSFMRESTVQRLDNYKKMYEQLNVEMDESTVQEIVNHEKLYDKLIAEKNQSLTDFNNAILDKTLDYNRLKNKNTKKANNILQQIANLENRRDNIQTGYDKRINTAQANHNRRMNNVQKEYNRKMDNIINRVENMKSKKFEQNERKASQSEIREQLFKDTGIVSESLDHAKNISKAMMHNTDPIRLQEMVFGKELGGKINEIVFQQVKHNTAEKIRFQNKERSEIEELGISPRSKESAAAQKYGEKQYVDESGQVVKYGDAELKAEFPKVKDQEKIKKAARVIRGKYDTYIDMVNAEITKYGYDPIPKRQDYMRHFQELNDVFSRYGLPFNMQSAQANDLPVDINGLTADLKPGKNWFASALRRKGVKTTYDAITGIDGYIEGIGNLIYHTGDIQKLRGFEDYIREIYGQEHGFDNLDNLPEAEKAIRMSKIQDNHLGNYAAWVREYTNALAGKKAMVDRAVEDVFGRKIYSALNEIKSQVGSNMTGLNIGSALTNPISMTQALAKTSKLATLKGYADTVKNIFIKDNFVEQNDFLTNRFGSEILSPTMWQQVRNAGQIFMTGTDWFASNAITRSKFYELKAKGLSDADAHKQAGEFAARILGDRSQGATPTLYNSKMLGLATQFQLEVNNQLYSMFYDTVSDAKQKAKTKGVLSSAAGATFVLGQLAAYQHIYNNLYESIAGRRPAFDILAILATALGIGGDDEDEEKTAGDRLFEAADMLVDSLPYVSIFTGGGRIPISEALPIKELFSGKDEYGNDKSRLETLGEAAPYYFLPTGYSQLKKTTSGLKMYDDDLPVAGSYTDSGNLRFTAEDDPMSKLQAAIFGQWANPNAKEYIDSEFKSIDKSNIDELVDLGFDSNEYKDYKEGLNEIKKMELKDGESRATYLFDYINKQDVTEEQKDVMIKNLMKEGEIEDLSNLNMTPEETIQYYEAKSSISQQVAEYKNDKSLLTLDPDSEEYKEAVGSLSDDKKSEIIDTIKNTDLPDDQKAYLYGKYYSSDKTLEKVISSGISFDNYLTYQKDSLSLETSEDKAEYLYNADMSEKAKTVIYETSVLTGFDNEKKYKDYKTVKAAGIDINSWLSYTKQEFKADKNSKGKSISGSRKNKIAKYINSLSLSIPQKGILLRTEYPSEDKYNKQIVNYVSKLDLSYEEKVEIFENLDMTVKNGRVYWD